METIISVTVAYGWGPLRLSSQSVQAARVICLESAKMKICIDIISIQTLALGGWLCPVISSPHTPAFQLISSMGLTVALCWPYLWHTYNVLVYFFFIIKALNLIFLIHAFIILCLLSVFLALILVSHFQNSWVSWALLPLRWDFKDVFLVFLLNHSLSTSFCSFIHVSVHPAIPLSFQEIPNIWECIIFQMMLSI